MSLGFFSRIKGTARTTSNFLIACVFLFSSSNLFSQELSADPAVLEKGSKIFKNNCTTCHAIHEVVIGPALKDAHERQSVEWITAFIKNSQKVIASGDEYAVNLYNKYKKTQMTAFGNSLTDEDILSVISYIKAESAKAPVIVDAADTSTGVAGASGGELPVYFNFILIGLIAVLVLILVVLAFIINFITKYVSDNRELTEEDREVLEPKFSFGKLVRDNTFLGILVFVVTAVILKTMIDGLFTVGVQQGYQPKQPIAFSHKIHAGTNQIDCNYCHTGVRKGKSANIPSANICMNCHSQIKTESPEIAKIYAAIDYNVETGEYGKNVKPIEWVRIHNLPDLAYFNHSQHVKVGNIECQTCHGPIEEMDVVYQHANLTMGWCINCHRETSVNAKGNEYYDKLIKLHGEKSKEPMKVEDIGGLECSKCHY